MIRRPAVDERFLARAGVAHLAILLAMLASFQCEVRAASPLLPRATSPAGL